MNFFFIHIEHQSALELGKHISTSPNDKDVRKKIQLLKYGKCLKTDRYVDIKSK